MSVSARALNIREPTFAAVRPMRDEAPTVRRDRTPVVALDDDERLVRRGDVEVPTEVVDQRLRAEDLGQLGSRPLLGEPSAHVGKSRYRPAMDDPTAPPPVSRGVLRHPAG